MMCVAKIAKVLCAAIIGSLVLMSCVISEKPRDDQDEVASPIKENLQVRPNFVRDHDEGLMGASCSPDPKKLAQQECRDGLVCVPKAEQPELGSCMIECGAKENGRLVKRPEKCPAGLKCLLYSDAALSPIGMLCAQGGVVRNEACLAPLDTDACARGLTCLPTEMRDGDFGRHVLSAYRCKEECSVERPCEAGGRCTFPRYARKERQPGQKEGAMTTCDVKKCATNDPACPCNKNLNYACEYLLQGIDIGFCIRTLGICESAT